VVLSLTIAALAVGITTHSTNNKTRTLTYKFHNFMLAFFTKSFSTIINDAQINISFSYPFIAAKLINAVILLIISHCYLSRIIVFEVFGNFSISQSQEQQIELLG